jgi:hypothetical protein
VAGAGRVAVQQVRRLSAPVAGAARRAREAIRHTRGQVRAALRLRPRRS